VKIKPLVFLPPFGCFALALLQALGGGTSFFEKLEALQVKVLGQLGGLFSWGTALLLLCCLVVFVSPLGKVRIGGENAKPFLSKWQWFAITLCTTVAVGVVFWGTAEPLFHFHEPPAWLKDTSQNGKILFSLSSLFFHWSLTPYAIYSVPALVFALTYYNAGKPFSLSTPLSPLLGDGLRGKGGQIIDAICLFSLVAGMSASLGTGVLTLSGGLKQLFPVAESPWLLAGILGAIVITFVFAAVTGITKGIRIFSEVNSVVFALLAIIIFLLGPTLFILKMGWGSLLSYFIELGPRSLFSGNEVPGDLWMRKWTLFYWCNWLSWAPVTALFLGRISFGYTVRETLVTNLILPSVFAWIWMAIFGGWALKADIETGGSVFSTIQSQGAEAALYFLLGLLPISHAVKIFLIVLVLVVAFLAYVTSAEANTSAMAALSSQGISPENPEAPVAMKVIWGICIGLTSGVMVANEGVDGIRTLSVLGGIPSLFLILLILASLIKLLWKATISREAKS